MGIWGSILTFAALAKMMRQVRHWTALDLLHAAGPKATGTGVSRANDEDELYKAVILEELAHTLGKYEPVTRPKLEQG